MSPGLFGVLHIDIRHAFADRLAFLPSTSLFEPLLFVSQKLSQFWIINVMRNFLPKGLQNFFFFFAFWSNHFNCDLHLILLPLAFHPASLHASIKVSLSNSDAVSMQSCLTAATNLDWTVVVICLPLLASLGNTCRLLSVILLLPKIFLRTLCKRNKMCKVGS